MKEVQVVPLQMKAERCGDVWIVYYVEGHIFLKAYHATQWTEDDAIQDCMNRYL
jgi:hypothetical protein